MADVLVTTDWVAQHANDADVRVVEVDVDTTAYDQGHVPGRRRLELDDRAVRHARRATSSRSRSSRSCSASSGIDNKTTIILYGDNNNWFAAWAFWQLKMYGHEDVRIMDGGRKKWLAEGRDLSTDKPTFAAKTYKASGPGRLAARVPARSAEGVGRRRRPRSSTSAAPRSSPARSSRRPGFRKPASAAATFRARRAFPGRKNCNDDGTFKSVDELKALYGGAGRHRRQARDRVLPHRRAFEPSPGSC